MNENDILAEPTPDPEPASTDAAAPATCDIVAALPPEKLAMAKRGQDPKTGRFLPGNKGRTGITEEMTKRRKSIAELIHNHVSPQMWGKIVKRIYHDIENGSPKERAEAARLLLNYAYGQPRQVSDVTVTAAPMTDEERAEHVKRILASGGSGV